MNPLDFINISIANPLPNSLYETLVLDRSKEGARLKMESECVRFINGASIYKNMYFSRVKDYPIPFNTFPEIYDRLIDNKNTQSYITEVFEKSNISQTEISKLIASSEYEKAKEDIQQVYIALAIIAGYNDRLLDGLTKMLIICHLIEKNSLSAFTLDDDALNNLIRATIILPTKIFPLPANSVL